MQGTLRLNPEMFRGKLQLYREDHGTVIAIEDVKKSFGGHHVLKGVNLTVQKGETMVIMGCSGCGKSVLLQMLVGLVRPDSGTITIWGERVSSFESEKEWNRLRPRIGFLFQGGALFDSMTVADNIAFPLRQHTFLSEEEIRKQVEEKLKLVKLDGIEDVMPAELSGGMQKRVALARTLALDPEIVIFDEPTAGLDPVRSANISQLIKELQVEPDVTSVVVTHDLLCIFTVSDRIALLHDGRIMALGTPEEIRNSENPYVRQFIEGSPYGPMM